MVGVPKNRPMMQKLMINQARCVRKGEGSGTVRALGRPDARHKALSGPPPISGPDTRELKPCLSRLTFSSYFSSPQRLSVSEKPDVIVRCPASAA